MKKLKLIIVILAIATFNFQFSTFNCFAQLSTILDFNSTNGSNPHGDLFFDGTYLYGMAKQGGTGTCSGGCGILFKIKPDGSMYSKLLDFTSTNGSGPSGSLISDGTYLYGMTQYGGINDYGVIFKIMPDGSSYTQLFNFDFSTGYYPTGSLYFDGTYLYGMTMQGGTNNLGTIFKIKPDGTMYSILLEFWGNSNGAYPNGSLISDGTYLYGMASQGGMNNSGTIFRIKPDATDYSRLFDFTGLSNGAYPRGSLISDGTYFYGMTTNGGTNDLGVVFKIKPDGTGFSNLLDFNGASNGSYPNGSLTFNGPFLYGTTWQGGANNKGVIFKIKPDGTGYIKLYDFTGISDGQNPAGSLVASGSFLCGTATSGGSNNIGTVFKYLPPLVIANVNLTMVSCFGGNNGTATVTANGGKPPYTYSWNSSPPQYSQTASGLIAGNYSVTVTDSNNTTVSTNITITEPGQLIFSTSHVNVTTCNGSNTGSITITANGGTGTIQYSKDGGSTFQASNTFSGLVAGTYPVVVKDTNNCLPAIQNVVITEPQLLSFTSTHLNVACHGSSTGTITVTASGGTGSYQFSKDGGTNFQPSNFFTGLPAGTYSVVVKDVNNCLSSPQSITITEPATVISTSISSQTDVTCYGGNDGAATISASGGSGTFTYLWAPAGGTAASTNGLVANTYTCTVTDAANGCIKTQVVTITQPNAPITPAICMVTVDSMGNNNEIYWDKTLYSNVDSFIVYRYDVVSSSYLQIGAVSQNALSMFTDTARNIGGPNGGDPQYSSYQYKLALRDPCGNMSAKSPYHQSIFIQQTAQNFSWNAYTIEGSTSVSGYQFMRNDNGTGTWNVLVNTSGLATTDPNYALYPNGKWRVQALGLTCTPTRTTVNTTRSNIKHSSIATGINSQAGLEATIVYPNPANEYVSLELPGSIQKVNITIMNSLGQMVYEQTIVSSGNSKTIKQINTVNFAKGVYTIVIESNLEKAFKKLVIN